MSAGIEAVLTIAWRGRRCRVLHELEALGAVAGVVVQHVDVGHVPTVLRAHVAAVDVAADKRPRTAGPVQQHAARVRREAVGVVLLAAADRPAVDQIDAVPAAIGELLTQSAIGGKPVPRAIQSHTVGNEDVLRRQIGRRAGVLAEKLNLERAVAVGVVDGSADGGAVDDADVRHRLTISEFTEGQMVAVGDVAGVEDDVRNKNLGDSATGSHDAALRRTCAAAIVQASEHRPHCRVVACSPVRSQVLARSQANRCAAGGRQMFHAAAHADGFNQLVRERIAHFLGHSARQGTGAEQQYLVAEPRCLGAGPRRHVCRFLGRREGACVGVEAVVEVDVDGGDGARGAAQLQGHIRVRPHSEHGAGAANPTL